MYRRNGYDITKREAQRLHSIKRGVERYGAQLTGRDLAEMVRLIKSGKSRFVHKLTNTRMQHALTYQGIDYVVVYDRTRGTICSLLPPDAE